LPEPAAYAAIDLGATSGRVVTGRLDGNRMSLEEVHRFPNQPVRLPDGLRWNLLHLFTEALQGLRRAGPLAGVGVDTWGVDYALLDARGRMLGLPFHYRDERTAGMAQRAFARVPRAELYARTGIQTLPINTIFQLLADRGSSTLGVAERLALVPDLLAHWLCGELVNESTNASTTGLLDARSGEWASDIIARLGLPVRIFGELVEAGTALGPLLGAHDLGAVIVYAVATHDTASAFAAAPVRDEHAAILSSGTWSLVGIELPEPVLSAAARDANLTNERGVDGTTRLLKNVMGMWLLEECRRTWAQSGLKFSYEDLHRLAQSVNGAAPLFDPDDGTFLAPGEMPARIAAACARSGQAAPTDVGDTVRSILLSLACKYRWTIEHLEAVGNRDVRCIHVIGGGARNPLLCRLTADICGREVLAGPVEATALGNLLVQARAAGELGSLSELRAVAAASVNPIIDQPSLDREAAEVTYRRFLDLTGLREPTTARRHPVEERL
jgi:rhamnulokinase